MNKIFTFLLIACSAISGAQNLSKGLQACYPLDNDAQNYASTGSALDGTLVNVTSATGHTGTPNTALELNGSVASYIELPDHPGLKSDSVFFSGWFRFNSFNYLQYLVYTTNGCSSNFEAYSLTAHQFGNKNVLGVSKCGSNCGTKPQIFSQTSLSTGTWYHVSFFIDNSVMKLYVDGVLEASATHNVQFGYQSGMNVYLGVTNQSSFNEPFDGAIDNVRFYNRELTQQEVGQLFTQDPGCVGDGAVLPVTSFTASKQEICENDSISFNDLSANSPTSWNWLFQGGIPGSSTLQNPSVIFPTPGIYTVSLVTSNSAGQGNTSVQTITVSNCVSVSSFSVSQKKLCHSGYITFTDQSTNSPTGWNWHFPGASPATSSQQNPTAYFPAVGVYTVYLTASNASGQGNTSVQTITVSECVSIIEKSNELSNVSFYPNPASDKFYIESLGENSLLIYDVLGKTVKFTMKPLHDSVSEVTFLDAVPGTYLMKLLSREGGCVTRKLIIVK